MKRDEAPLTRAELARLMQAFATLILRAEEQGDVPPPPRSHRRAKRSTEASPIDDEFAARRAHEALRRAGLLP